jgi:hypothetical protein
MRYSSNDDATVLISLVILANDLESPIVPSKQAKLKSVPLMLILPHYGQRLQESRSFLFDHLSSRGSRANVTLQFVKSQRKILQANTKMESHTFDHSLNCSSAQ